MSTEPPGPVVDEPVTWHYGLLARWWAEVNEPEPDELAYYRRAVERYGEPALDLGCGTGRLLVPLLVVGLDVDGTDVSADMLDRAREAGEAAGIEMAGRLTRQSFAAFSLPRRHRTIYCCDSFGIGGSRAADERALRRLHDNLEPGGAFVFSIDRLVPGTFDGMTIPEPWPAAGRAAPPRRRRRARAPATDRVLGCRLARRGDGDPRPAVARRRAARRGGGEPRLRPLLGRRAAVDARGGGLRRGLGRGPLHGTPRGPGDETVVFVARR